MSDVNWKYVTMEWDRGAMHMGPSPRIMVRVRLARKLLTVVQTPSLMRSATTLAGVSPGALTRWAPSRAAPGREDRAHGCVLVLSFFLQNFESISPAAANLF